MAAPTYRPEVDTNATRQPADPAGIPATQKSDGFREITPVPNTSWNWLFKTINDWIGWLLGTGLQARNTGIATAAAGEVVGLIHTVPANTMVAGKSVVRMSGMYQIMGQAIATLFTMRIRTGTPLISMASKLITPNVGDAIHMAAEFVLDDAGTALDWTVIVTEAAAGAPAVTTHQILRGSTPVDITVPVIFEFTGELDASAGVDAFDTQAQSLRVEHLQ